MDDEFVIVMTDFDQLMTECRTLLFLTIDDGLKMSASDRIAGLVDNLDDYRQKLRQRGDCDRANLLLAAICYSKAVLTELRMWMSIRQGNWDASWTWLVDSGTAYRSAFRAHKNFLGTRDFVARLDSIENLLFPSQTFMSAGLLVESYTCSICERDYDDCTHVAGRPYCGEFCSMVAMGLEFDHSAIVDSPSDKVCRVTEFEVEGGFCNKFTHQVRPFTEDEMRNDKPGEGMRTTCILMRAG